MVGIVGLNVGMWSGMRAGSPATMRALTRWLVAILALVAVFALHVLTAENAPALGDGVSVTQAPLSPAPSADWMTAVEELPDSPDPSPWASARAASTVDEAALGNVPAGVLQDPWAAGCLLFLAALWVLAVLRRRIPRRLTSRPSWWPGVAAWQPLWPVSRLSLGVTRI